MSVYDEKPWLHSYDPGIAPELNIPNETYVDLMERAMKSHPDIAAFHFLGSTFSFKEFDRYSMRFAAYLRERGCGPGDVVGINLPNTPQYLIALAGALRAGCTASGVSPLLTPKEMANQLNDSGAKSLVVMDAIYERRVQKIKDDIPALKYILTTGIADFLPSYKRFLGKRLKKIPSGKIEPIAGKEVISFKEIVSREGPDIQRVMVAVDDPCLIQYTGGTTGTPKGAVLTHRNIVTNIMQAVTWFDITMGGGAACSGFPFFHQAGLYFGMTTMAMAYTQCLIPDPRNTGHVCKEIAAHRPRIMLHVPSLYQMLMEDPAFSKLDFSGCDVCISGAAPFSKEGIASLESIVGKGKVVEIYGMTEASPLITMNPFKGKKKIGSVGIPLQNTIVKLVDVETGVGEVAIGDEGEIIVRGPQIMKEYHNKPKETAMTIRELGNENWLYTGDVGKMDKDGYFYIVDRTKDMLIVGGFKVFSREVEEVLCQHRDVEICAIIGMPNPDRPDSQIVKAVIQLSKNAGVRQAEEIKKGILDYCRENLASYKVPKEIDFTRSIPLTPVGKVDKKALRVQHSETSESA